MVTEEHHLAKILEGYETRDWTTFRRSLENFYTLRDLIRALRSLSVRGPLYADLYALLLQVCPGAATGLRISKPEASPSPSAPQSRRREPPARRRHCPVFSSLVFSRNSLVFSHCVFVSRRLLTRRHVVRSLSTPRRLAACRPPARHSSARRLPARRCSAHSRRRRRPSASCTPADRRRRRRDSYQATAAHKTAPSHSASNEGSDTHAAGSRPGRPQPWKSGIMPG
jgi:hypothetical protein